ncbi:helix-turn-helix domain-containing protein [Flavobacterium silvaticum]|uniref:Helix-turn-helix transcriptional regulator n=1 Tax=Flavobacterium silvaticum TaxID=1852020 RepID=A0A972JG77_9FLAO|nr:helix-turn-helix domain-containing protein [Flavobacterium silvaticum]NMH27911.1 helix-turn-helix transcriptional regulator [Flavobacterium silvaticum]
MYRPNALFRISLGISQQQMATLLNVGRSLYTMYELGKRNLPEPVTKKLIGLKAGMERQAIQLKKPTPLQQKQWRKHLEKKRAENKNRRDILAYHISKAQDRQQMNDTRENLVGMLKKRASKKRHEIETVKSIAVAVTEMQRDWMRLEELKRTLNILEFERGDLEQRLKVLEGG